VCGRVLSCVVSHLLSVHCFVDYLVVYLFVVCDGGSDDDVYLFLVCDGDGNDDVACLVFSYLSDVALVNVHETMQTCGSKIIITQKPAAPFLSYLSLSLSFSLSPSLSP